MEQIRDLTATALNGQTRTLSENQSSSTKIIPREQHAALFAFINKCRMLNGWTTRTAKELDATIQTWAERFNKYNIPLTAYAELYDRVFDLRQSKMRDTGENVQADAVLIVSQWTGEHGLARELERKRIQEGCYLPDAVANDCQQCFGTGMWNPDGKGLRSGCPHKQED